ncbi:glycosyltransferase family 4 protein [Enorma massiliensis]|uniref:glycosyltransferase family 4 protein n=1 Tax=Enorma massiliensis TaxID=1472761 RepID=UPI0023F1473B|nr:glycosyltransferase family 4 protein [Enorma massiliensis]
MRILVVCQHYWPEPFNSTDVCETLVARGHEVTVITGLPNTGMPGNEIPAEWKRAEHLNEVRNGVRILRAKLHPRKNGAVNRVLNYLSFWLNANRLAKHLDDDFDVVLGYQFSPVMQVDPGIVYAKRHGKRMLLYCFDLWPASLLAGGFKEDSLPFTWMKRVSKKIYSEADAIAVTSPLFDEYFCKELELNIPTSVYLPQYAEDMFLEETCTSAAGFDRSKLNLTFAGNVGSAQSVETIIEAASLVRENRQITFHIVGSGSHLEKCEELASELKLDNVVFHGRKPLEEMPAYYTASDAMLVTFADSPMARYTLPRKVQSYLAAGKPILAAASGETERVIREARCGYCCGFEDAQGLARIANAFFEEKGVDRLGENARRYYWAHFTKEAFYSHLEQVLAQLTKE